MKVKARVFIILAGLLLPVFQLSALEIIIGLPYGTHTIGHTSVRVKTGNKSVDVIYDFGRYGKTWGYLKLFGEGVMRVWRGPAAVKKFFTKQTSYRSSIGFEIDVTPEEEQKIFEYYESLLRDPKWVKKHPLHKRYRLSKDYHGVTNQCTSMALDGLKVVWPRERWEPLLDPKYNNGKGFSKSHKAYFFKIQKKLGIGEVVVPLDVLDALNAAMKAKHPAIIKVHYYYKR